MMLTFSQIPQLTNVAQWDCQGNPSRSQLNRRVLAHDRAGGGGASQRPAQNSTISRFANGGNTEAKVGQADQAKSGQVSDLGAYCGFSKRWWPHVNWVSTAFLLRLPFVPLPLWR